MGILAAWRDRFSPRARAVERWAANRALPLERASEVLGELVGDRSVVFIGESDHFAHETHVMRRALVPALLARGTRVVIEELGAADGRRADRYLETGDTTWLDRMGTFGDRSMLRLDRDDTLGGPFAKGAEFYPHAGMRFEHGETLATYRPHSPRFVGIDHDTSPGGIYQDLPWLERVTGESRREEIARIQAVIRERPEHAEELAAHLEGLAFVEASHRARGWNDMTPAMAAREACMHRRAQAAIATFERAVVLAHVGHLPRGPGLRHLGSWVRPPAEPLGARLAKDRKVGCIWMLHGEGESAHPVAQLPASHPLQRGTLNAILTRAVAEPAILSLRRTEAEVLLVKPVVASWSHGGRFATSFAQQCDALVWFPRITPLRRA